HHREWTAERDGRRRDQPQPAWRKRQSKCCRGARRLRRAGHEVSALGRQSRRVLGRALKRSDKGATMDKQDKGDKQDKTGGPPLVTRVEVICEGCLGTKLLQKGDVTDDPEYVALLDDPRGLVVPA